MCIRDSNWSEIIKKSTIAIHDKFEERMLIYKNKFRRTEKGAITLGLSLIHIFYVEKYDDGTGTLARRKKKSFDWYKEVIASNGENL